MTWNELAALIASMTEKQKADYVTAFVQSTDEFTNHITLEKRGSSKYVLDENPYYLEIGS